MKILTGIEQLHALDHAVVTTGTFDGVHLGHQKILKRINKIANKEEGTSVVVTFWPHPRFVLGNGWGDLRLLTTFDEKAQRLSESGVDVLVRIPFTRSFSELSSDEFIRQVISKLGTKKLVIGYDHKFGRNREGSFEYLQANHKLYGFEIEEIPRHEIDSVGVSSTKIRKALNMGEVDVAGKLLGRPYVLTGIVTKGDQLGRTLGFPTANIHIAEEFKLIPGHGVYAVMVHLQENKVFGGMMNIGIRPTISGTRRQIEVNIFDFDEDIYGRKIQISFVQMLREERRFESKQQLAEQLHLDKRAALKALN